MGVHGLWDILKEVKSFKTLEDIRNETLAVDLATWICEAQAVGALREKVSKPYLRNLFFRLHKFIRNGVKLIFVVDGKPPELKWKTIARRLDAREDIACSRSGVTCKSRSGLNGRFKECCHLLSMLGVPWIKAEGEAEATCAALNAAGLVDACITSDGDAFLYGAKKVYRNLTTDKKKIHVECYEMVDIERKLQLNRNALIAMALLLGCDYAPQGVPGVGKVQVVKLFSKWNGEDPIYKMRKWKVSKPIPKSELIKPSHCSTCKHTGTKRDHLQQGCPICKFACTEGSKILLNCTCEWHVHQQQRKENSLEEAIIEKANNVSDFPNEEIIVEFQRQLSPKLLSESRALMLSETVQYLGSKLEWPEDYAIDKTLSLLTYWKLHHPKENCNISINCIKRTRTKDGIAVFEIEWLLPVFGKKITLEPQDIVQKAFPEICQNFWQEVEKSKKSIKKKPSTVSKGKIKPIHDRNDQRTKITDFYQKEVVPLRDISSDLNDITSSMKKISLTSDAHSKSNSCTSAPLVADIHKSKRTRTIKAAMYDHDLSFSPDFSLGQSILNTPNTDIKNTDDEVEGSLGICTPTKEKSFLMEEPGSPVFMSLAERIRLKNKQL
ncbi:unnamed protein product [Clavelina lepadiformis]|uniref:Flap endonuclease GEN n=1 Tax=Clavelina lepadiformis TaxID=159417 RepID=A0ABP0FW14_CLALP